MKNANITVYGYRSNLDNEDQTTTYEIRLFSTNRQVDFCTTKKLDFVQGILYYMQSKHEIDNDNIYWESDGRRSAIRLNMIKKSIL